MIGLENSVAGGVALLAAMMVVVLLAVVRGWSDVRLFRLLRTVFVVWALVMVAVTS